MRRAVNEFIIQVRRASSSAWKTVRARLWLRDGDSPVPAEPTHPELPACTELTQASDAFKNFGHTSDERFTELAHALFGVSAVLRTCQGNARTLVALADGQDPEQALPEAQALYKSSIDLVHASIGLALCESARISEVEAKLLDACKSEAVFLEDNVQFRILAFGIKIESARLPPDNQALFSLVAQQISEIDQRIAATIQRAFARITEAITAAATERGDLNTFETTLRTRSLSSINTIQQELTRLQALLAPCASQGQSIDQQFSALQPEVLALITALQAQDIVRQKLEHVGAGFQDIAEHLVHHIGATPPFEPPFLTRAARVQREQLREARRSIEQAAETLSSGLQSLSGHSAALGNELNDLSTTSVAALRSCQVHELFHQQITELSRIADLCRTISDNIAALVGRIEEVVTIFFSELNALSYDVKIVALNAQIASARTHGAEALTCLASEAARIADNTDTSTGKLTGLLASCLSTLRLIKDESAQFLILINAEQRTLEAGFHLIAEKLARLCSRTANELDESNRLFASANSQIQDILPRLNFPALVSSCFNPAEKLSDALFAAADSWSETHTADLSDHGALALARHEGRYTMKSENTIHATVVGVVAAAGVAIAPDESDIELFDAPASAPAPTSSADDMELFDAPMPAADAAATPATKKAEDDGMELF
jgi:hypothetical protein